MLSSPVNSFLRIKQGQKALELLQQAQQPMDIITDEKAKSAKEEVKKEHNSILKSCESVDFKDLAVVIFNSNYRMSGYMATTIQEMVGDKTVIAINKKDGHGSMRGELALYWEGRLKHLDYVKMGGHPGFYGFQISKPADVFIEDLTELLQ